MPKKEKTPSPDVAEAKDYVAELAAAADEAREANTWSEADYSGQLAVDVYEDTANNIVIRAAIAGVRAEDLDITVNDDVVTIKGIRRVDDQGSIGTFLYQECYWGGFSRTIILPVDVDANNVTANIKAGILRVMLPKIERPAEPTITITEEEEA